MASNGSRHLVVFAQNGKHNDGPHGEPAYRIWHANGVLKQAEHFRDGERTDGRAGEPGYRRWNERRECTVAISYPAKGKPIHLPTSVESEIIAGLGATARLAPQ